ncbi:hypothetical protein [Methylacidiphilum kamchatkense]|uniref:hypothetical protein n=1 Tax=Methylacidiphilum kamchatkense TaxID=431057 RepID=UPI000B0E41BF|nr:hypothetical protein [Methylacidiphilum kamchatkense]
MLSNLLIVIYVLLLTEGILRKWILPEFSRILFFIRDPFVIYTYWLAMRLGLWRKPNSIFLPGLFLIGVGILLAIYESFFAEISPLFVLYGLRNYFLYLPLPFLMERALSKDQLDKIAKWTLIFTIPMAPLCFFQSISPADSPINAGFAEDPELTFKNLGVSGEIMRAHGTFTQAGGLALFIGSALAFFIYGLSKNKNQKLFNSYLLWITGIAILATLLISGSRTAFFLTAIVFLGSIIASLKSHSSKLFAQLIIFVIIVAIVGSFLSFTLFSNNIEAMYERWTGATEYEGGYLAIERIVGDIVRFSEIIDKVPLLGFGLGTAGNAFTIFQGEQKYYVEDDWSRNIYELGPIVGLLFLMYRITLFVYLGYRCWKATGLLKNPLPFILFAFIIPILFNGQITGQGTTNGYAWIFTGFCLIASQINQPVTKVRISNLSVSKLSF